jgi:UDP:flavonoid glycosyltransferase YjiC (YdhE family)
MNATFFGFPARSHTVPSLALVRELTARGVAVTYYSTAAFRGLIESAGARFAAYPAVCDTLCDPADLHQHVQRVSAVSGEILPNLTAALNRRPNLIVFDASAPWGQTLAHQFGKPAIASITTFAFTQSMLQILGISDPKTLGILIPKADLKIVYTSRFFQPAGRFLDDRFFFLGPLVSPPTRAGSSVAYVSLGTIFNRNMDLLKRIAGYLSDAGWQVVVSLGNASARRQDSAGWPSNVQVHNFVDQIALLSHAGLAVTHGGMASVSEAFACGVPIIAVPQSVDQFLVARRAAELGASVTIDADAPASVWQAALSRMETERAAFAAAAARIAASFSDVVPISAVVDRLLELVRKQERYVAHG